jgi:hypothetical protein
MPVMVCLFFAIILNSRIAAFIIVIIVRYVYLTSEKQQYKAGNSASEVKTFLKFSLAGFAGFISDYLPL